MKRATSISVGLFFVLIISVLIIPSANAEPNYGSTDFSKITPELTDLLSTNPDFSLRIESRFNLLKYSAVSKLV